MIVAVNSDASTKRLKGDSRPVNPLEQRMIVLGALEAVDWVVSFEEDTPQRLIAGILPDLLVKGGAINQKRLPGVKKSGPTVAKCWCSTLKTVARRPTSSRRSNWIKKANWKAVHRSRFVAGRPIDAVVFST